MARGASRNRIDPNRQGREEHGPGRRISYSAALVQRVARPATSGTMAVRVRPRRSIRFRHPEPLGRPQGQTPARASRQNPETRRSRPLWVDLSWWRRTRENAPHRPSAPHQRARSSSHQGNIQDSLAPDRVIAAIPHLCPARTLPPGHEHRLRVPIHIFGRASWAASASSAQTCADSSLNCGCLPYRPSRIDRALNSHRVRSKHPGAMARRVDFGAGPQR